MTSVLPPSASDPDDEYAFNRAETPRQAGAEVPGRGGMSPQVLAAVVIAVLFVLGTLVAVLVVWGGRLF